MYVFYESLLEICIRRKDYNECLIVYIKIFVVISLLGKYIILNSFLMF